jgi:hypothetical protein
MQLSIINNLAAIALISKPNIFLFLPGTGRSSCNFIQNSDQSEIENFFVIYVIFHQNVVFLDYPVFDKCFLETLYHLITIKPFGIHYFPIIHKNGNDSGGFVCETV